MPMRNMLGDPTNPQWGDATLVKNVMADNQEIKDASTWVWLLLFDVEAESFSTMVGSCKWEPKVDQKQVQKFESMQLLSFNLTPYFLATVIDLIRNQKWNFMMISSNSRQSSESCKIKSSFYPRRCETSSFGQSAGLSILRSSVRFRQKLKKLRTLIYMDLRYIDPEALARVLNYCFK